MLYTTAPGPRAALLSAPSFAPPPSSARKARALPTEEGGGGALFYSSFCPGEHSGGGLASAGALRVGLSRGML